MCRSESFESYRFRGRARYESRYASSGQEAGSRHRMEGKAEELDWDDHFFNVVVSQFGLIFSKTANEPDLIRLQFHKQLTVFSSVFWLFPTLIEIYNLLN